MKGKILTIQKYWFLFLIMIITFIAFVLRVKCCYWGYPLQLHPDEGTIINGVIDMLSRHSWEAHSYNRPDHFEIKCDAILFTIVSWLKYHKPAYEAFEEHKMAFYMLGRFYTTLFGVALVPLMTCYVGKLAQTFNAKYIKIIQICTAVLTAFSAVFVQHSAYATPDVVLAFFVVLFAFSAMNYIEDGNKKCLHLCIVIIGIGITIKYPAAILLIPLAAMVIYRAYIVEKKPLDIVRYGLISIGLILFTIFVIAPNLVTDINTVYINFIEEARTNHLGADGLGFVGNLKYYLEIVWSDLGTITIIPFIIGLIYIFLHQNRRWLSLLIGLVYWICMSVLALHWLRWGIPMYPFYILIVAIGIGGMACGLERVKSTVKSIFFIGNGGMIVFTVILLLSVVLSGLSIVKYSSLSDLRLVSRNILDENGITEENCLYEGYTPFAPSFAGPQINEFNITDKGVKVSIGNATKEYFIMSDSFKGRFFDELERYPEQCAIYNGIDSTYDIIYKWQADGNYETNKNSIKNIINSWKYLTQEHSTIGYEITVYDLKPEYIGIQAVSGQYLAAVTGENESELCLADDMYQWVQYETEEDKYAMLSSESGMALNVGRDQFTNESVLELCSATGEVDQQWQIVEEGEYVYLVCSNNMALTYSDDGICISEFSRAENQRWILRK